MYQRLSGERDPFKHFLEYVNSSEDGMNESLHEVSAAQCIIKTESEKIQVNLCVNVKFSSCVFASIHEATSDTPCGA